MADETGKYSFDRRSYRGLTHRTQGLLKLRCHKHPYLQTFLSNVFIFCVQSNCIREFIKKATLSLIHLKSRKHTSFPQSFRVPKCEARLGTGTSLARAMTIFSKQVSSLKQFVILRWKTFQNSIPQNIVLSNPSATALNL